MRIIAKSGTMAGEAGEGRVAGTGHRQPAVTTGRAVSWGGHGGPGPARGLPGGAARNRLLGRGGGQDAEGGGLRVVATTTQVADLAANVGGTGSG